MFSLVMYLAQLLCRVWHYGHDAELIARKALQAFIRQSSTQRIQDAAEALACVI